MKSQLLTFAVLFAVVGVAFGDKCAINTNCVSCRGQVGCHWCSAAAQVDDSPPELVAGMGACRSDCGGLKFGTLNEMFSVKIEGGGSLLFTAMSMDEIAEKNPLFDMSTVCTAEGFPTDITQHTTCKACLESEAGPWCKLSVTSEKIGTRHGGICGPKGLKDCSQIMDPKMMEGEGTFKDEGTVFKIEECTSSAVPALAFSGSTVLSLVVAVLAFSTQSLF